MGTTETGRPWVGPGRVEVLPGDMTFLASGDVTLSGLDAALVRAGWWWPVDGEDGGTTLRDVVEAGATGPLRLGFGGIRDLLLGVQFEDGRGRLVSAGGRVMKNVAGYDLTKFMVGSRGVFGRVVSIAARAYLRPEAAMAVRLGVEEDLGALSPRPQWAIRVRSGVWVGYVGRADAVDLAARRLEEAGQDRVRSGGSVQMVRHGPEDDAAMRARLWQPPVGEGVAVRLCVPPGRLNELVLSAKLLEWVADPWHGVVLTRAEPAAAARLAELARDMGGFARWDGALLVSEPEAEVLRRLKAALDPHDVLRKLELTTTSVADPAAGA